MTTPGGLDSLVSVSSFCFPSSHEYTLFIITRIVWITSGTLIGTLDSHLLFSFLKNKKSKFESTSAFGFNSKISCIQSRSSCCGRSVWKKRQCASVCWTECKPVAATVGVVLRRCCYFPINNYNDIPEIFVIIDMENLDISFMLEFAQIGQLSRIIFVIGVN
jgi:hypothetical protein